MQIYCVIGKININGHIGDSFVDPQGQAHAGTNLLSVIDQVTTYPEATSFEISINSPGGYVDVGDAIYDYLISLKKQGKTLTTIQTGLVGSIATKLFLAGDRRIVDDRYQFWIHNPFQENVSGDADAMQSAADQLGAVEKSLRKFYGDFTQISDEGLDGLMKIETGLTADQCIKFKFATEKKLVPAFNAIKLNKNKMANKKEDESLKAQLMALLGVKSKKGVQPKAEIPGGEASKNLVVNLADGAGSFWVEGEAVAEGANAFLLDADGQPTAEPLADGEYPLEDGSKATVAGGVITAVMPAESANTGTVTLEQVQEMINAALKTANEKSAAEIEAVKEEAKVESEARIQALKATLKLGIQPKNPAITGAGVKLEYKSINDKMREKAEARKKQLNNN